MTLIKTSILSQRVKKTASNARALFQKTEHGILLTKPESWLPDLLLNAACSRAAEYWISPHPGMIRGHWRLSHSPKSHWRLQDSDFQGSVNFSSPCLILTVKITCAVFFLWQTFLWLQSRRSKCWLTLVATWARSVYWALHLYQNLFCCFYLLEVPLDIPVLGGSCSIFTWEHFMGQSELHKLFCSPVPDI